MRQSYPISLVKLLSGSSGPLKEIISHSHRLHLLNQTFRIHAGDQMADNCVIADLDNGVVYFNADSPAWSHRLRYEAPELLEFLKTESHLGDIRTFNVRVRPPGQSTSNEPPQRPVLQNTTRLLLRDVAQSIDNPALSDALMRLAQTSD